MKERLKRWLIGGAAAAAVGGIAAALWEYVFGMPGEHLEGELPPPCRDHDSIVADLKQTISFLADDIGERHLHGKTGELHRAADFIVDWLEDHGFEVERQPYVVGEDEVENLVVELPGDEKPEEIVVVGAHYDTVPESPGANDNGTGIAATLLLACMFKEASHARTMRFVFFVNEEAPYFQTDYMGSYVYAEQCHERGDDIMAMICPETIGYFSDEEGSQEYPGPLEVALPTTGNFIAFVSNIHNRKLVQRCMEVFRQHATIPSEGAALPGHLTGVGWSDHWSFWQFDYPALMVTDTAPFRYPFYHTSEDEPDKIDYDRTARVVDGLRAVLRDLVRV